MATWPTSLGNPQFSGYDLETTDPTVRTDMEGGSARVRRRYTAAPDTVSLKFLFDTAQMATFRAFWDYDLMNGAAWVYMPVKTGYLSGLESRECRPTTGKFKSVPVSATHWLVEFQVEVRRGVYVWYDTINAMKLPSLELDFAGTQSLNSVITSSAQPVVSVEFSRSSVGTYFGSDGLIKTAAADEPRFDFDPITHVCKGLLIEEGRTNLLTYSEQFDNAAWTLAATTVTANAITAPDGTTTADRIVETVSTSGHNFRRSYTLAALTTYTVSYFVKAGERSAFTFLVFDSASALAAWAVNLATGEIVQTITSLPSTCVIQALKDGWYRVAVSFTATAAPSGSYFDLRLSDRWVPSSSGQSYTGDGASGLYAWGAQLEAGSFPTSYIPTTSSSATRAADVAQMTGANFSTWYRQDEGTLVAEWRAAALQINYCPWGISDGTSANTFVEAVATVTASRIICKNATVTQINTTFGTIDLTRPTRTAAAYKNNDAAFSQNGGAALTDLSCTIPTVFDRLRIGDAGYFTSKFCGHIAKFTYYPKRLDNATLQALSA